MKFLFTCLSVLVCLQQIAAQNIGLGTNTPHASAMLDVTSTNKGLLVPRVTQANRPASPATGLLIYQTNNTPGFYYYNGSTWIMLLSGSGFSLPYTGSSAGNAFNITSTDGIGITGASSAASGNWYGGQFTSASTAGSGLYAAATAATGTTYGGQFANLSTSGRGVYGEVTASSGNVIGVYGKTSSSTGIGVYGESVIANAANGQYSYGVYGKGKKGFGVYGESDSLYGVYGQSNKPINGVGVVGIANNEGVGVDGSSGTIPANRPSSSGVVGRSQSGAGVFGSSIDGASMMAWKDYPTGNAGYFRTFNATNNDPAIYAGTNGQGSAVQGIISATTGFASAISGQSFSVSGTGVTGASSALTGTTYGVRGFSASPLGTGVLGRNGSLTGSAVGVNGYSESSAGYGVLGVAASTTGVNYGVFGNSSSVDGRAVSGVAYAVNGTTFGVTGESKSPYGYGGFFFNDAGGFALKTGSGKVVIGTLARATGDYGMVITDPYGYLSSTALPVEQWGTFGNHIYSKNDGYVGIGTSSPGAKLDVFQNFDVWHSFIGGATGRLQIGGQAGNGAVVQSWNPTTNQSRDLYLQRDGGKVGIGAYSITAKLDIVDYNPAANTPSVKINSHNLGNALEIIQNGTEANGVSITNLATGARKVGLFSMVASNANLSVGVVGIAGEDEIGGFQIITNDKVGVEGINRNAASGYGVSGKSKAPTGAGVLASYIGTGTGNALIVDNGFIKVAGTNRTAFQVVSSAANTSSNSTSLSYPNASNTDIVTVTPVWTGTYLNSPIGIYFTNNEWRVFRQDLAAMPNGITFNVIVIKQ